MASRKKVDPAEIHIPQLVIKTISVRIIGMSELIMHNFSQKSKEQMAAKQQKKAQTARAAKNPVENYGRSFYLTKSGHPCMPSTAFKAAMVASIRQVAGMTMKGDSGAFHIRGSFVDVFGTPRMREDMARNQTGVADIRYRAGFPKWCCEVTIDYNANAISTEQLVNLVNVAGFGVGIGDWRPGSRSNYSGNFGRFVLVSGSNEKDYDAIVESTDLTEVIDLISDFELLDGAQE
jgi:hypothetical protein